MILASVCSLSKASGAEDGDFFSACPCALVLLRLRVFARRIFSAARRRFRSRAMAAIALAVDGDLAALAVALLLTAALGLRPRCLWFACDLTEFRRASGVLGVVGADGVLGAVRGRACSRRRWAWGRKNSCQFQWRSCQFPMRQAREATGRRLRVESCKSRPSGRP